MVITENKFVIIGDNNTRILKGRGNGTMELIDGDSKKQIIYFNSKGKAHQMIRHNHGSFYWVDKKVKDVRSKDLNEVKDLEVTSVKITTLIDM